MRNYKLRAISMLITTAMLLSSASGVFAAEAEPAAEPHAEETAVGTVVSDAAASDEEAEPAEADEADEPAEEELSISALKPSYTDREKIELALERLALINFTENRTKVTTVSMYLPTSISLFDDDRYDEEQVSVLWSSSDEAWLTSSGEIVKYEEDGSVHYVTLTAVLTAGEETATKEFKVAIKPDEEIKSFPGADVQEDMLFSFSDQSRSIHPTSSADNC